MQESVTYQDILQKGAQQGRIEGRREEALSLVMRLLTRRFGEINPQLQEQIRSLWLALFILQKLITMYVICDNAAAFPVSGNERSLFEVPILIDEYQRLTHEYQRLSDEYQRLSDEYQSSGGDKRPQSQR
ncbi:MAG: hypothetical protein Fur006_51750 [Coleofasciculaceae cyanobacterium]